MTERQPGADQTPIPIALMKRLAEAASGFRNREDFWLVCRYLPVEGKRPYDFRFFPDQASAEQKRDDLNGGAVPPVYGAFGPFTATGDPEPEYGVKKVTMEITPASGPTRTVDLGEELKKNNAWNGVGDLPCDTVVWSLSALEKFVLPYYTYVEGIEGAERVRAEFLANGSFMVVHLPTTDYVNMNTGSSDSGTFVLKIQDGGVELLPL